MLEHKHIIIRAKVERPPLDVEQTKEWFRNLIEKIDMKLLAGPIGVYLDVEGNRGMTMVAIIETSHIAMHVWDEQQPALMQLDVYTCGALDPQKVFDHLQVFKPVHVEHLFLDRENNIEVLK
jgi:S-adenosylmethionine/arginine decarboxylase-like enzyme